MVPSGIKIGKEQLNVLGNADDIALIRKNEIEIFCRNGKHCQKVRTTDRAGKDRNMIVERKSSLKKSKIGHLKIKNYKFERVENFKYSGVILNEDNNNQIDLQEGIKKMPTKHILCYKIFLKNKIIPNKLQLAPKNTTTHRQNSNRCSRNWDTNGQRWRVIEYF